MGVVRNTFETINNSDRLASGYFNGIQTVTGNVGTNGTITPPIGSVISWLKTFAEADSGTTDGTTANKLVQSGQNFSSTVEIGMIVHNTTDDTFSYVTSVDSNTTLSLNDDIMVSGENFVIYKTPNLPDGWVECDGSVLSDSDSPYDGVTVPDLNGGTYRMLRGALTSGGTGGSDTHTLTIDEMPSHTHDIYMDEGNSDPSKPYPQDWGSDADVTSTSTSAGGDQPHNNLPAYYEVVWIMRIK